MKQTIQLHSISSLVILAFILTSCADPITDRELVATLTLRNICSEATSPDSLDIVMRFIAKDTIPVVDADIYRRIPAGDSLFKLNLRLKESDSWWIKDIRTKSGNPFCEGLCIDTLTTCKAGVNDTRFGELHPVADTIRVKITCACRLPF